jgi:DNA polymerase
MNDTLDFVSFETNNLSSLKKIALTCEKCSLCETRTNVVFDNKVTSADLMIVGEAPGAFEDEQGLPFVGKAGNLLTLMLKSIGLTKSEVYITNVVKCRPPENRNPSKDEINSCMDYLNGQINIIKPKIILGLGKFAGITLLNSKEPLKNLRGKIHDTSIGKVMLTYHPAYLMRNPIDKSKSYDDLILLKKALT